MKSSVCVLSLLASLAPELVLGQVGGYGQCGGSGYTESTECTSGYYCTSYNPYYEQCVPGTASATASASTSLSSTSVAATTTSTSAPVTTVTSSASTRSSTSAVATSTGGFAKTNGLLFEIDGMTKYWAGTNCYWCGFLTADADVDHVMADIASSGLKILRVWGFNDVTSIPSSGTVWYQYLSSSGSQINTGADGLERLDYVVKSAEANGIKLIINFVNNWSDYGGMAAYVTAFGLANTSVWYTDTTAQTRYQTYIEAVVSRYKGSSAVFAWELANEPRCSGCDTSVIYNWAATTSAYIKSLDPDHMVTMGDEGFGPLAGDDDSYPYTTSAGGYIWETDLDIDTLDFGTLHLYPDSWGQSYSWGDPWISLHGAACVNASKPCLLEEYGGGNNCTVENPWQATALATDGIAGDMFWQYGDVLPSCSCETSQDGNTVYFNTTQWTCMVTDHIDAIHAAS